MVFEIIKGDYGSTYTAVIEDNDYSSWTVTLYVWDTSGNRIVNGLSCTSTLSGSDTYITFTPTSGLFDVTEGRYYGLFKMTSSGKVERTKKFAIDVFDRERPNTTSTSTSTSTTTTTSTSTSTTAAP